MTSAFISNFYDFVALRFILFCYIIMQSIFLFYFLSKMKVVLSIFIKLEGHVTTRLLNFFELNKIDTFIFKYFILFNEVK